MFPDPDNPAMLRGFEVDLAAMIAEELGVSARFQQGQWDRLPPLLGRSTACVLNGIALTAQRNRDYRCSRPYYAYALQLLARRYSLAWCYLMSRQARWIQRCQPRYWM